MSRPAADNKPALSLLRRILTETQTDRNFNRGQMLHVAMSPGRANKCALLVVSSPVRPRKAAGSPPSAAWSSRRTRPCRGSSICQRGSKVAKAVYNPSWSRVSEASGAWRPVRDKLYSTAGRSLTKLSIIMLGPLQYTLGYTLCLRTYCKKIVTIRGATTEDTVPLFGQKSLDGRGSSTIANEELPNHSIVGIHYHP